MDRSGQCRGSVARRSIRPGVVVARGVSAVRRSRISRSGASTTRGDAGADRRRSESSSCCNHRSDDLAGRRRIPVDGRIPRRPPRCMGRSASRAQCHRWGRVGSQSTPSRDPAGRTGKGAQLSAGERRDLCAVLWHVRAVISDRALCATGPSLLGDVGSGPAVTNVDHAVIRGAARPTDRVHGHEVADCRRNAVGGTRSHR